MRCRDENVLLSICVSCNFHYTHTVRVIKVYYWYTYRMKLVRCAPLFVYSFPILVSMLLVFLPVPVFGEKHDFATVASPIVVSGNANNHDIVSYHSEADLYKVSGAFADESMFGVIVDDPVLYMESDIALQEGARPVVRHGEAIVNVSTIGGSIRAGDIITTSPILGVGQRAEQQDATYILGFALDSMSISNETVTYGENEYRIGTVPVALRIGPYLTREGIAFVTTGKEYLSGAGNIVGLGQGEVSEDDISAFKIFRYILAAVIAISSVFISIGRFGDAFKQSVVSVGRNPLARGQIRSILFWNIILIILVSGAGLGVAAAIIIIP